MKRAAILGILLLVSSVVCAEDAVIRVNGENISREEYDRYVSSGRQADDLIDELLLLQEARRRGISAKAFAGEEEIEELVMSDPVFYSNGYFDSEKYKAFTLEASLEAKAMRDRAEERILAEKKKLILIPKTIGSIKEDIDPDDPEVTDGFLSRAEKMRVDYICVDPFRLADGMDLRQDDIRDFYSNNRDLFFRPAYDVYATVSFDPDDYVGMVSITQEMLKETYAQNIQDFIEKRNVKARYVMFRSKDYMGRITEPGVNYEKYYSENMDKFIEPAQVHAYLISIKKPVSPNKLYSVDQELNAGILFSDIARKYSDDPSAGSGGDLGMVKKGVLKEPFNGIAFSLAAGETSGRFETENGYYYLHVAEKRDMALKPLDQARGEIESALLSDEARPMTLADAKRFRVDAMRTGFEEAAKKRGMAVFETGYFTAGDRIPSIGDDRGFTSLAASMRTMEVSPVIACGEGFIVCVLTDSRPQKFITFDDVAEKIKRKLVRENSAIFAENAARHSLDLFNEKVPVSEIAKRTAVRISYATLPATAEAPSPLGKVEKTGNAYGFTVLYGQKPGFIPEFSEVSYEAASLCALRMADDMAMRRIEELRVAGAMTMEGVTRTLPFSRSDYIINGEYMKPFIEQCFKMKVGETGVIKSEGRFYLVRIRSLGIESADWSGIDLVKAEVLREKREQHLKDWLKEQRERSEISINL